MIPRGYFDVLKDIAASAEGKIRRQIGVLYPVRWRSKEGVGKSLKFVKRGQGCCKPAHTISFQNFVPATDVEPVGRNPCL